MVKKVLWIFLIFLVILVEGFVVAPVYAQNTLDESLTNTITLRSDGSATWRIEHRFLLATQEDVTFFEQYLAQFEAEKQFYLQDFANRMQTLVSRASLITGRSMGAENFQVVTDLVHAAAASYGVIVYSYEWVGFAKLEATRLVVGDVFEGGFYLYQGDAMIVVYPFAYGVVAASPIPDETRSADRSLVWYGRRNFGAGEPTVILEEELAAVVDDFPAFLPWISVIVAIVVGGFAILYFVRRRNKPGSDGAGSLRRVAVEKMADEEEKVIKLLRAAGGKLFQSQITRHCGFSASKTSELLSGMEKKRVIKRKTQGREKLVILVK
jgi:hypothetical protein